jgi:hypothetical protein
MQDSISKITVWEAWVKPESAYLASAKKKKKKKKKSQVEIPEESQIHYLLAV